MNINQCINEFCWFVKNANLERMDWNTALDIINSIPGQKFPKLIDPTEKEVKKRITQLQALFHPDTKNETMQDINALKFKIVGIAGRVLLGQRELYDPDDVLKIEREEQEKPESESILELEDFIKEINKLKQFFSDLIISRIDSVNYILEIEGDNFSQFILDNLRNLLDLFYRLFKSCTERNFGQIKLDYSGVIRNLKYLENYIIANDVNVDYYIKKYFNTAERYKITLASDLLRAVSGINMTLDQLMEILKVAPHDGWINITID